MQQGLFFDIQSLVNVRKSLIADWMRKLLEIADWISRNTISPSKETNQKTISKKIMNGVCVLK